MLRHEACVRFRHRDCWRHRPSAWHGRRGRVSAGYFQPAKPEVSGRSALGARFGVEISRAELMERRTPTHFEVKSHYAEAVAAQRKLAEVRSLPSDWTARITSGRNRPVSGPATRAAPKRRCSADATKQRHKQITFTSRARERLSELRRTVGLLQSEPLEIPLRITRAFDHVTLRV